MEFMKRILIKDSSLLLYAIQTLADFKDNHLLLLLFNTLKSEKKEIQVYSRKAFCRKEHEVRKQDKNSSQKTRVYAHNPRLKMPKCRSRIPSLVFSAVAARA
jgi:hypothetical protein